MSAIVSWGQAIAATGRAKSATSSVRQTHPAPPRPTEVEDFSFHENYPTVVSDNTKD